MSSFKQKQIASKQVKKKESRAQSKASLKYATPSRPKVKEAKVQPGAFKMTNPNALQLAAGGHGKDINASVNAGPSTTKIELSVPTASQILQVTVEVTDRAISYLAMGIVLRAIRKGLMPNQLNAERPYYMFMFLIDAFTSAMRSGVSILTEAPIWWWEIYHALKPKMAQFKTGTIQYKWSITNTGQANSDAFSLGSGVASYTLFWGTSMSGGDVNGFPILAAAAAPYTPELGIAAIPTLWASLDASASLIPDPGSATSTYDDTSAFAVTYPELGASYNAVGAFRSTLYSETFIDKPIFAQFASYQPQGTALWRGWHHAGLGAGSASMVGPRLMDCLGEYGALRNKIAPTVKIYNFDEIFEQLSLTMCLAQEAKSLQQGQTIVPCPLTSQQVQILLRQAIIGYFNNDMFQDLRYNGPDHIEMLPFVVGPNGSQSATVDMRIPTFLAENIRCMKSIDCRVGRNQNAIATWYPVLTRPAIGAFPPLGQYLWGVNNPLYNVDPAEVFINIIDMSAQQNNATVYLDASRLEIQVLKDFWNEWIADLTGVLSPLVSLTSQHGIRALNCNILTNSVQHSPQPLPPVIPPPQTISKRKSIEHITSTGVSMQSQRKKLGAAPANQSSYFEFVVENEVDSVQIINPALWPYLSQWILPVDFAEDNINEATSQGVRAFQVEPNKIPRSSAGGIGGGSGVAISKPDSLLRHLNAATVDVKAFATFSENALIKGLVDQADRGNGGFFTSLVSGLVNTFSPTAANVISTVGNLIGV